MVEEVSLTVNEHGENYISSQVVAEQLVQNTNQTLLRCFIFSLVANVGYVMYKIFSSHNSGANFAESIPFIAVFVLFGVIATFFSMYISSKTKK